jgi:hypothetical protein
MVGNDGVDGGCTLSRTYFVLFTDFRVVYSAGDLHRVDF